MPGRYTAPTERAVVLAVVVAALGYFVDIYDLILFGVVRNASLLDLGVAKEDAKDVGIGLINLQMIGMLIGGILWGVIGDRKGRLSVLFASILTYSLANIANGLVTSVPQYGAMRFIAGIGLAGELGVGITLVGELMKKEGRGWGTTIVAAVGICGGVVASLVGGEVPWRTAYFIGGGLGLLLLVLRIGVRESHMSQRLDTSVKRGDFFALFRDRRRCVRYLAVIAIGIPIWYAVGVLILLSPELGAAMGVTPAPLAARAFLWCYAGLAIGDLASGALSQVLRSRKQALAVFLGLIVAALLVYFTLGARSQTWFYAACAFLGLACGYWAVFVTTASEQFGTNLRATAATTAPNFVRAATVPCTLGYQALTPSFGVVGAAIAVGAISLALAFAGLWAVDETYGKDLDFVES